MKSEAFQNPQFRAGVLSLKEKHQEEPFQQKNNQGGLDGTKDPCNGKMFESKGLSSGCSEGIPLTLEFKM